MIRRLYLGELRLATIARASYLIIQGGASAVVFALLARMLSASQLGAAATALAVYTTSQIFSDLGFVQFSTVAIPAAAVRDPEQATALAATAARFFIGAAGAAFVLSVLAVLVVPGGAAGAVLAIAPASATSLVVNGAESLRRAVGDVITPVKFALSARLPFFALVGLITLHPTATVAMAVFSLGAAIGCVPALISLIRLLRLPGASPSERGLLLRGGLQTAALGIGIVIATRVNSLLLARLAPLTQVGQYEAAWRAFQPFVYLAGAIGSAAMPYASRAVASGDSVWRIARSGLLLSAAIGVLGGVALYALSVPLAEILYGRAAHDAVRTMEILAVALPFSLQAYYLQNAVVLPRQRFRVLHGSVGAMVAVTLAGTVLLRSHGAVGCATALTAGQIVYTCCLVLGLVTERARKHQPVDDEEADDVDQGERECLGQGAAEHHHGAR